MAREKNSNTEKKSKAEKPQTLSDDDIVTKGKVGRRSAISVIGAAVAGTTALVAGSKPAHADRFDVSIKGDPQGDTDSGRFADRAGDDDLTIPADVGGETTDNDLGTLEDPADRDAGRREDPGDFDPIEGDPVGGGRGGGRSDPTDLDIEVTADRIPSQDKDKNPADFREADVDEPQTADPSDTD